MAEKRITDSPFKKLIGKWKTEGKLLETDQNPEMKIEGIDIYKSILDGFFIQHKANVLMGEKRNQSIEFIGLTKTLDRAKIHFYEQKGTSGTMKATITKNEYKIESNTLRFSGKFIKSDNEISGTWQQCTDTKKWTDLMTIKLTKY